MAGRLLTCSNCGSHVARSSTGMIGVTLRKHRRRYGNYQYFVTKVAGDYIGTFPTLELAGRAYDAEAKKRYGKSAKLNFPEEKPNEI